MKYIIYRIKANFQLMLMLFVVIGIFLYIVTDSSFFMLLMNILVGFSVITVLGYQYDKKSTDYYYSLPISKTKLFMYNQIAGYMIQIIPILFWYVILIIVRNSHISFFNHFAFMASITYTYLIFSLITSLSHNHIDTVILMIFYYVIPYIGISSLTVFLKNSVLGFPFDKQHADLLIRMTTFYIDFNANINMTHIIIYCVWYIVCMAIILKLTYYFVRRRKVEYSGGNFPHPLIYTFIKAIIIWIYLITTSAYAQFLYPDNNLAIAILRNNLYSILIGLILFIIFTAIQRRNLQIVLSSAVKYLIVAALFLASISFLSYVKINFYENKIPSNVVAAQLDLKMRGISIHNHITNDNLIQFKEKENLDLIKEIHEDSINRKYYIYGDDSSITISYQTDKIYPIMRKYSVMESDPNIIKLYQSDEFKKIINSLFENEKEIMVHKKQGFEKGTSRKYQSNDLKELILNRVFKIPEEEYNVPVEYSMDIKGYHVTLYFEIE